MGQTPRSPGAQLVARNASTIIVVVLLAGATFYLAEQAMSSQQALNSLQSQVSILRNQSIPTVTITPATTISFTVTPTVTVTTTVPPILHISFVNASASASGGIEMTLINDGNTPIATLTVSVSPVLGSDTFNCANNSPAPGQTTICTSKGSTLPSETKSYNIRVIASNVMGYYVTSDTVVAGP
jgi:hypothetical protein